MILEGLVCILNSSKETNETIQPRTVEQILKESLDSIPSPSIKIQIMGGKVCLRWCQQTFESKKFVDITQQCFALIPQVNFPINILNFH